MSFLQPETALIVDVRETLLVFNLCVIVVVQRWGGGGAVTFCTLFSTYRFDHCLPLSQTGCLTQGRFHKKKWTTCTTFFERQNVD